MFNGPYYSSLVYACLDRRSSLNNALLEAFKTGNKGSSLELYREEIVVYPSRKRHFDDRVRIFLKNVRVYVTVTIIICVLVQENSVPLYFIFPTISWIYVDLFETFAS